MTVVIIDNYDSFTYNLAHGVAAAGGTFAILRNSVPLAEVAAAGPTHLILSSGPGDPADPASYGVCREALEHYAGRIPVLGVCLGHQVIALYYGAALGRMPKVRHGWVSQMRRTAESALFDGLGERFEAMRYHSHAVTGLERAPDLRVTRTSEEDGWTMAVEHRELPVFGVQFHPESVGTPAGATIFRNFLRIRAGVVP